MTKVGDGRLPLRNGRSLLPFHALARVVALIFGAVPQRLFESGLVVEAGRAVVIAFAQAMLLAFVAIVVLLLVVLRSPLDTLLVTAQLLLAALLTVAGGPVAGPPFNIANVTIPPLV